ETQKRPLDDALSDLALRLGETCWILETNEISYVKGSTLKKRPLDAKTTARLEAFFGDLVAQLRTRTGERVAARATKASPNKDVLSTKGERQAWIKARKEELAKKLSVKSESSLLAALELACALLACERAADAKGVLDLFADVEFAGDYGPW